MPKNRALLSLIAVPLIALLVACGGGDKDKSSSDDGGTSGSSSSDSSSGDDRASGDDVSLENCKQYASLESAATAAFSTTSDGKTKLDKGALEKLVKASPKEIKADMQTLVDGLVAFFDALDKAGLTDPSKLDPAKLEAAQAEMEKATAKLDDKKFQDASDRVEAYFEKECS